MKNITAMGLIIALAACETGERNEAEPMSEGAEGRSQAAEAQRAPQRAADNTARNDRAQPGLTPGDQSETEADRAITQRARQNVVGQDELSMNAKNVKIITRDGVVTLRGPVASEAEKSSVIQLVKGVDGVKRVEDQLEVMRGR